MNHTDQQTRPEPTGLDAQAEADEELVMNFLELILGDATESAKAEPIPAWLLG
jgi:hypothetical protein